MSDATPTLPSQERRKVRKQAALLSPMLLEALAELAASEQLPVGALIAVLINEALERRLHRRHA